MGIREGRASPAQGRDGGDRNGHVPSCWLHVRLTLGPGAGGPCPSPHPGDILSPQGAAHSIRRGPKPHQNGAQRAAMVLWESKRASGLPQFPGHRRSLTAQPPAWRGAAEMLPVVQAVGLPLSLPPLLCRMAPSPNASACLHSPNEKQLCLWKKGYFGSTFSLSTPPTLRQNGCCSLGELRGAISTSLRKCLRASPGGDPGQGTRAQCHPFPPRLQGKDHCESQHSAQGRQMFPGGRRTESVKAGNWGHSPRARYQPQAHCRPFSPAGCILSSPLYR